MTKSKPLIVLLVAVVMVSLVAGCIDETPDIPHNEIRLADLTEEQQEIVDLLGIPNLQEVLIFDFSTEEAFSNVEFWVEVYRNGIIVDRPAGVTTVLDEADEQSGRLAVTISKSPNFQWTLSVITSGTRSNHASTTEVKFDPALATASSAIEDPVIIEDGKEIVLHKTLFTTGSMTVYDHQTIQERPELLREYLHAQIIKCKFVK